RQLEERRAGIEQSGDPLARGQLAALLELGPAGLAVGPDRGLEGAKALDQREHLRAVLLVAVAAGVEVGVQGRHDQTRIKNSAHTRSSLVRRRRSSARFERWNPS